MSLFFQFVPLLVAMLVLMAGSAFCSASEAALFYLSRDDRKLFAYGTSAQKRVVHLLSESERLLTSILFWNLMMNVVYFALASRIDAVLRTQNHSDIASTFTLGSLFSLILFGEMLPKNLGVLWPQTLSAKVSLPISAAMYLLRPILPTFLLVNRISLRTILPNFEREPYLELRDIERAISISTPDKTLAQQEELILHQIVWLSEMEAEELMRPRMGLTLYSAPVTLDDLRANPPNCDYLLVSEADSEEIERAMPLAQLPSVTSTHLESACERVPYVPWCASGAATLDLLRHTRSGLAVVINELGETIGIVTLDDVMHALFANPAVRQTSRAAAQSIEPLGDDVYKVNGAITLRRLSKQLKFELPMVKSVTIAGMLQEHLERIPEPGDELLWGNCRFTVIDSPRPGVLTATVERLHDEQMPGEQASNGGGPMITPLLMFGVGFMLSSFFSGTETGFYRLNRARLLIHALEGDWISRALLWAANNPAVFVATALVGNNVANYIVASSIGMAARIGFPNWNTADVVLPALLAPVLFVYGELLPKNVFLAAPNRLLRRCGIPLAIAAVLFAPISIVLWFANKLLEAVGRKSPALVQMRLARRELGELLDEGQAVGLLQPTQQALAQATISLGPQSIAAFVEPVSRFPRVAATQSPADALAIARRTGQALMPVEEVVEGSREITSYVRAVDCALASDTTLPLRPIVSISEKKPYLATLSLMLAADAPIARVTNRKKQTVGYVTLAGLQAALMAE